MHRYLLLPILLLALVAVPGTADAGKRAKHRCPAGATPVVKAKAKGKRAVPKRDRRGRVRCRAIKVGKPPAPSAAPLGQAGNVADALRDVPATNPRAVKRLEKALGRKRARRMLDVTLDGWQQATAAARAAQETETTTFAPGDGVQGSLTYGVQESSGSDSGFNATATATVEASREGVTNLAPGLADKLPSDVKSVKGQVDVSFEDKIAACPDEKGERNGSVKAKGKVKVTVERDGKPPVVVEMSVEADMTYTSRSDGTIGVETQTTFSSGGSGVPTQTYRGRRLGDGFGRESIIDSGRDGVRPALERDVGHFDSEAGGVFGPKGGWNYARGIGVSDLRSLANVEAMYTAAVNTDLLTLAALEYARKVALPRADKEECGYTVSLNVDGRGIYATHDSSGQLAVTVITKQVGDGAWHGEAPAPWTNLVFTTKNECPYHTPVSDGYFMVDLTLTDAGMLQVKWHVDRSLATASVDCPPDGDIDPPPISGQPGPGLPGAGPLEFELPATGGSMPITGGVVFEGDGFYNDGVLSVTRVR